MQKYQLREHQFLNRDVHSFFKNQRTTFAVVFHANINLIIYRLFFQKALRETLNNFEIAKTNVIPSSLSLYFSRK